MLERRPGQQQARARPISCHVGAIEVPMVSAAASRKVRAATSHLSKREGRPKKSTDLMWLCPLDTSVGDLPPRAAGRL